MSANAVPGDARMAGHAGAPILKADHVSKQFNGVKALDSVNLEVGPGEIVCLLGANGAGKTTLVNSFLGFLAIDEGEILVDGRPLHEDVVSARSLLAYVPDRLELFAQLTGTENLEYFAHLSGAALSQAEAVSLLERSGLSPSDACKRLSAYSRGMRQKVGIAIALAKSARALLLDEPLSGLDPLAANDFGERLRALRDAGIAILMVTHDVFRAREVADRIGIMRAGRLVDMVKADSLAADALDRLYVEHMRA